MARSSHDFQTFLYLKIMLNFGMQLQNS